MKNLKQQLAKTSYKNYSFASAFNKIIARKCADYDTFESFLNNVQCSGRISGLIGEFIYHKDCKKFYIKHIDDLEAFKTELEEQLGESIINHQEQPHYTFMCWLAFEEYCCNLYSNNFNN